MENKTISYLNSKIWYRTLKVFYVLFFLCVFIGGNILGFTEDPKFESIDTEKTKIICNFGDKKEFSIKSKNIYLSDLSDESFDYKNFFKDSSEGTIKDILGACYETADGLVADAYIVQRTYEITGTKENRKQYDEKYLKNEVSKITTGYKTKEQKIGYLNFNIQLFDIKPVFSHDEYLKFFLVFNLGFALFFEIIRRIFYYIILGTFKPRK